MSIFAARYTAPLWAPSGGSITGFLVAVPNAIVVIQRNGVNVACYSDRLKTVLATAGTPLPLGVAQGTPGVDTNGDLVVYLEWGDGYSANVTVGTVTTVIALNGIPADPLEPVTVAGITSGTISGITDLAVADGGTGASSGSAALTNLGGVSGTGHTANSVPVSSAGTLADLAMPVSTFLMRKATGGVVAGTPTEAVAELGSVLNATYVGVNEGPLSLYDSRVDAPGDGTDQTSHITAAINLLPAAGGEIFVPPGIFGIIGLDTDPLGGARTWRGGVENLRNNVRFRGAGDASVLKALASDKPQFLFFNEEAAGAYLEDIAWSDITFDGRANQRGDWSSTSTTALYIHHFKRMAVRRCRFIGWLMAGVNAGISIADISEDLFVEDNRFDGDNLYTVLGVNSFGVRGLHVERNIFDKICRPLSMEDTSGGSLTDINFKDNTVKNGSLASLDDPLYDPAGDGSNTFVGVLIAGSHAGSTVRGVTVTGNNFEDNGAGASATGTSYSVLIQGNTPANKNVTDVDVSHNRLTRFTPKTSNDVGIALVNCDRWAAVGNIISAPVSPHNPFAVIESARGLAMNRVEGFTAHLNEIATTLLQNVYFAASATTIVQAPSIATSQSTIIRLTAAFFGVIADTVRLGPNNEMVITAASITPSVGYGAVVKPSTDNAFDLGTSALRWRDAYFSRNVGIGTPAASYALNVLGTINFTGALRLGGNSIISGTGGSPLLLAAPGSDAMGLSTGGVTRISISTTGGIVFGSATTFGAFGAAAVAKPAVTGSRAGNAALASLLAGLVALGWVTDSSSA